MHQHGGEAWHRKARAVIPGRSQPKAATARAAIIAQGVAAERALVRKRLPRRSRPTKGPMPGRRSAAPSQRSFRLGVHPELPSPSLRMRHCSQPCECPLTPNCGLCRWCDPHGMRLFQIVLLLCALSACSEQPKRETWAVVVSIAPHANPKWNTDEVVVTARSQDGATGAKPVLLDRLKCRVGDTVHGSAHGLALTLDARACER
jgi:hypothetical protein